MRELPLRAARQQWPARALAAFCLAIEAAQMPNALAGAPTKKYDLSFCAVPGKMEHIFEIPDPELLRRCVLAFTERAPEPFICGAHKFCGRKRFRIMYLHVLRMM